MGGQTYQGNQPNQSSQVYYDPATQQYFTYGKSKSGNGVESLANLMFGQNTERMYLNNPMSNVNADRFTPRNITPTYPDMNMLFPALNTGLAQGLISSQTPTGAMYGAGRFLAPQTTSENKGK